MTWHLHLPHPDRDVRALLVAVAWMVPLLAVTGWLTYALTGWMVQP